MKSQNGIGRIIPVWAVGGFPDIAISRQRACNKMKPEPDDVPRVHWPRLRNPTGFTQAVSVDMLIPGQTPV